MSGTRTFRDSVDNMAALVMNTGFLFAVVTGAIAVVMVFVKDAQWVHDHISLYAAIVSFLYAITALPLSFLLLIPRTTRPYGAMGMMAGSYLFGFMVWISCLVDLAGASKVAAAIGLLFAGVGVVPFTGIMALLHGQWTYILTLVLTVAVVMALRYGGMGLLAWAIAKEEEAAMKAAQATSGWNDD